MKGCVFISRYVCSTVYTYTYNTIFGQQHGLISNPKKPGILLYESLSLIDLFYRCSTVTKAFPNATCMCVVCKTH